MTKRVKAIINNPNEMMSIYKACIKDFGDRIKSNYNFTSKQLLKEYIRQFAVAYTLELKKLT
jgi:hypothetical protein